MLPGHLHVPDSELEVLEVLWERGPSTAGQIRESVSSRRTEPLAHSTVVTLVQRLEKKGHVKRTGKRIGKAFVYDAVLKPERARSHFVRQFVSRHFGDDPLPLFSSLIEGGDLKMDEIVEMRKMLDDLERSKTEPREGEDR